MRNVTCDWCGGESRPDTAIYWTMERNGSEYGCRLEEAKPHDLCTTCQRELSDAIETARLKRFRR